MAEELGGTIDVGGMAVNRFGFGAMRITGEGVWGDPPDREVAKAVLRRAIELGINFIDTADSYGPAVSEELIHEALHPYPDDLLIATKGGLTRPGPGRWEPDGRPQHLREACEASLRRLGLEQLALYQLHRPDPKVPFLDSIGELATLRSEGKVARVGLSNVDLGQLRAAQSVLPIVSVQNRYSLGDRSSEPLVEACAAEGLAFLPWAPLRGVDADPAAQRIAAAHRASTRQVGLAFLLAHSKAMLPIAGTGSVSHLDDNAAAARLELSADEMEALTH